MVQGKVRAFFKKVFFNGNIAVNNVCYLKICVALGPEVAKIDWLIEDKAMLLSQLGGVLYQVGYPMACLITMLLFRSRLDDPFIISKIGNMYSDIHLTRNKYTIF